METCAPQRSGFTLENGSCAYETRMDCGYYASVSALMAIYVSVADDVDDDGAGEDEDVVFVGGDVDAVGVGPGEPAFGAGGDGAAGAGEFVFVVEEVAGGFEVIGAGDVN